MTGELKKIVEEWGPDSTIGATFVRFTPFLKMYADYSNKYEDGLAYYTQLMERKEPFRLVRPSLVKIFLSFLLPC